MAEEYRSRIISIIIGVLYPFILLFGFYIILNGHLTPGGGFQGGAILSAVLMSRYLVSPNQDIRLDSLQIVEKMAYALIVAVPLLFLLMGVGGRLDKTVYLVLMNALIGIKVSCGLSIVFFRFVFYESR
ncbi:MnhB domain-containing protein [Anaerotalea alkaliphila]|uniref:Sodium:proton antiporter n=1 Tax=Anaerotalea alkaliphila TaxID=2662126 RepID=A0A7X5HVX0_9FIRM|nr:MnhB domain-containing protein [Anaerotalea alkaliphila]NDL67421.1 sodium:proton antiporter [Anaerotalea alkaliphila]